MTKEEYRYQHDMLFSFIDENSIYIGIISTLMIILYTYFRRKINLIYLLDFILIFNFLFVFYIIIFPHRYHGVISFIQLSILR